MDAGADGSVGVYWGHAARRGAPKRLVGLTVNLRDTGAGPYRGGTTPTRMHFGSTGRKAVTDSGRNCSGGSR